MYVILTTKPGKFRTELGEGLEAVETWDYLFWDRRRAEFTIARLLGHPKVRIVEESASPTVNWVPSKFLPKFDTLDKARHELLQLAGVGVRLVKRGTT